MYHGDSQALYSDDNSIFPLSSNAKEALFAKGREFFMDSGTNTNYGSDYNRHFYGNQSTNTSPSGLLRFRSAPSSLLESLIDEVETGVKNSCENQGLASRFDSSEAQANQFSHSCNGYALNSPLLPQYPRPYPSSNSTQLSSVNGGYRVPSSIGVDHHQQQPKMVSNLTRQNSSPAELFSHFSAQSATGYAKMRGTERFRLGNDASEHLSPSSTMSKGPMNFSSGIPSSYSFPLGMLSRISEIESDNGGTSTGPGDEKLENKVYGSPFETWNNNPSKFAGSFTGLKREVDSDHNLFPDSHQGGENRNQPHILSHHLSLPKSSAGIAAAEKFFQFPDTVPCKIRAKRGFATHPRSIAERVRRTRISERMRKLQELVPYMDKETNTASMLDSAVDYIKDLQKQYKTLCDIRANCKCSAMTPHVPDQMA